MALRAELEAALAARDELLARRRQACRSPAAESRHSSHAVLLGECAMLLEQRDALLQERDELHAVVLAALDAGDAEGGEHIPSVAQHLAPLQARLLAAATERDLAVAERDALRAQLASCRDS